MQEKILIEGIAWAFTGWEFGRKGGWKSQGRTGKIYRSKQRDILDNSVVDRTKQIVKVVRN